MKQLLLATLPLACLAALGCGGGDAPELKPTPFDAAAAQAKKLTEATEQAAAQTEEADEAATVAKAPTAPEYTPPFPGRTELFSPPRHVARSERVSEGGGRESVVLLGFAELDEPLALVSVGRQVRPLAVGEEAAGVKVISISAPRVVLQRGSTRWTESIE